MNNSDRCKICIVNEFPDEVAADKGQEIGGPLRGLLFALLAQTGIERQEIEILNVFNVRPHGNTFSYFCGTPEDAIPNYRQIAPRKYIDKKWAPEISRLYENLDRLRPNVVIALGPVPLWALCKKAGIKKYRGAPLADHTGNYKVIPTWHIGSIFRQYSLRPIVMSDFLKAKKQSAFSELRRPSRKLYLEPDLADIEWFYETHLREAPFVSCDIETKLNTITEVGYGTAEAAMVIPFYQRAASDGNYWTSPALEARAWKLIRKINTTCRLIGQNFSYDMSYFWRTVGIPCPGFVGDTMIMHHALQPEMEKGLGFLGSLYTDEPAWKFMRTDNATLKQQDS